MRRLAVAFDCLALTSRAAADVELVRLLHLPAHTTPAADATPVRPHSIASHSRAEQLPMWSWCGYCTADAKSVRRLAFICMRSLSRLAPPVDVQRIQMRCGPTDNDSKPTTENKTQLFKRVPSGNKSFRGMQLLGLGPSLCRGRPAVCRVAPIGSWHNKGMSAARARLFDLLYLYGRGYR